MAKYSIRYYGTYFIDYEIEANSEEEAKQILMDGIEDGTLDPPDYCNNSWCEVKEINE